MLEEKRQEGRTERTKNLQILVCGEKKRAVQQQQYEKLMAYVRPDSYGNVNFDLCLVREMHTRTNSVTSHLLADE